MPTTRIEIIPYLFYSDLPAALEWLTRAFGFVENMRTGTPSGGLHAEMSMGGQRIMMGQPVSAGHARVASPRTAGTATMGVFLYLDDVDAHHARAAAAGAEIERPPHDESYGRTYTARDLDGHPWFFTTPSRQPRPPEG
ncbi:MAG TPA: VOC family protein [Acetobacteraceae bacterium]|nr:VOC family protein [Acetobacteraceae bacterium]